MLLCVHKLCILCVSRKNRHHPYADKNSNDMEDDGDVEMQQGGEDAGVTVFTTTRGRIMQRHKLEWKDLRKKIQKIRSERYVSCVWAARKAHFEVAISSFVPACL